jgi:hypothetical protein
MLTGPKLTEQQTNFIVKLMRTGKRKSECREALLKKYKRGVCDESLRLIARKSNIYLEKNGQLEEIHNNFIDKCIKTDKSQVEIIKMFLARFGRTVGRESIRRRARVIGHVFDRKSALQYTEKELSKLRGLTLIGKSYAKSAKEFGNRTLQGIKYKMIEMKATNRNSTANMRGEVTMAIKKGRSDKDISKKHNIEEKYVKQFRDMNSQSKIEVKNLKRWEETDVEKILDLVEQAQDRLTRINSDQDEANINITTNSKYVALAFISDIHLENMGTDIRQLRADINTIRGTKDFYVGFGGDLIDNFMVGPHKEGAIEAVVPPKAARVAAGKLFDYLKGRVLWTIQGCHDTWDAKYADYNLPEHIARKLRIPFLGHGGDINLNIKKTNSKKEAIYSIHARHKYRGGSGFNGTAPCKKVLTEIDPKFDIVAISHNHFAEIKIEHFLGKERCFIRTGSYKREDRFSKQLGYQGNDFNILIPVVIMNTQTRQMKVVSGISNAADMLKALNK